MSDRSRGQAHTLEAVVASMLLVGSLVFALQVTAVTPLSASTSSQHVENQQRATAAGVLDGALADDSLRRAVLYCDPDTSPNVDDPAFHEANPESYYTSGAPTNQFGRVLDRSFGNRSIAYNVYVTSGPTEDRTRARMVYQGEPSDNAVAVTRTLTLYDDDVVYETDGDGDTTDFDVAQPTDTRIGDGATSSCYGADADTGSVVNQVVEVEVVVWRQ